MALGCPGFPTQTGRSPLATGPRTFSKVGSSGEEGPGQPPGLPSCRAAALAAGQAACVRGEPAGLKEEGWRAGVEGALGTAL